MGELSEVDVAVIGGGSAGYAAARTCAAGGLKTAVIEGGREVGGLCILRGCMPTKALLYVGEVRHLARSGGVFGLRVGEVGVDAAAVFARKDRLIQEFAAYREGQLRDGRFEFIRAEARFKDAHTLELSTGGSVRAKHFVVATGSAVAAPPLPALAEAGYLTSDEALSLRELPESLIVLGGGAVAVELAQFFCRMGVQVTLVQRSGRILREEDPEAAAAVETVFRREGMTVYTGTRLTGAARRGDGKVVTFEHGGQPVEVAAEEILFALGRRPHLEGLQLEQAGVETVDGRIATDAGMRTSAPHIYAAGDCTGPYEIVHIAIQQGEIAARNILAVSGAHQMDYRLLISVVFTDPQVARVGLTEAEAKSANRPFLAASYPFGDHGKSMLMEARDGFVKLLADPGSGEILGGSCCGPVAGELIHEIVAAMAKHMTVAELAALPHYHPTLAEIWTYPAEELAEKIAG